MDPNELETTLFHEKARSLSDSVKAITFFDKYPF